MNKGNVLLFLVLFGTLVFGAIVLVWSVMQD